MKNLALVGALIIVLMIIGGIILTNSNSTSTGNSVANNQNSGSGNVQNVVLSLKNGNYYPNTITVNVGQPVSISLDDSIRGCYRFFTIPELNLQKSLPTPSDALVFTPTQKGTYRFQCGMGMGYGTLVVQ